MKLRKANTRPRLFRDDDVEQMTPKQISISGIWYEYLEQENASSVSLHGYKTSKIDCANGVRRTCYLAFGRVRCRERGVADSLIMAHNETPLFTSCGNRVEPHRTQRDASSLLPIWEQQR